MVNDVPAHRDWGTYATKGTSTYLNNNGLTVTAVYTVKDNVDRNPGVLSQQWPGICRHSGKRQGIGDRAFGSCTSLKSVTIGDNVTIIGPYAFETCMSLTKLTLPCGVISIGDAAFAQCISLNSVTFIGNGRDIGKGTFTSCTALSTVNILGNVTTIGISAF